MEQDKQIFYKLPEYYDIAFSYDIGHESNIIRNIFKKHAPFDIKKILEPACGTGRFLTAFPKYGIKITGYDLSESFVEYADNKIKNAGMSDFAEAVIGNMKNIRFDKKYDSAFNSINSLGYLLKDEDIISHFRNTADSINTGGVYVIHIDCCAENSDTENSFSEWECKRNDITVNIKWGFAVNDKVRKISNQKCILKINDNGKTILLDDLHELRLWYYDDLKKLIAASEKLKLEAIFDESFNEVPLNSNITGELGNLYYVLKVI